MKNQNILRSTAFLTLSGIIAKTIDFVFRAYYSRQLGGEGLGIFSLVFSVHGIMLNISSGGFGMAVSKIVSEQYTAQKHCDIKKTMRTALTIVFALSTAVIFLTAAFSHRIAEIFLKEPRCRLSIIYLSPSILFMGLSYCIKGYFYASRKIFPPASSEFLEQAVKIITIKYLLGKMLPLGIEHGCEAVFLGISIGEFSSCFYLFAVYSVHQRTLPKNNNSQNALLKIIKISLPVMITSISGSFLRMQEQVMILSSLHRFGLSSAEALSRHGLIHGMAMPLIVFPLTLLSSCFTMLIPEISRAKNMQNSIRIKTLISRIYRFTALFGFMVSAVVFIFSENLAYLVYKTPSLTHTLRVLCVLAPVMFMDSVSSGMLNGMGKQNALLFYSISDSLLRIILVNLLIPKFGIKALLGIIFISNLYTMTHTVKKVLSESKLHFAANEWLLRHFLSALITCFISGSFFVTLTASAPVLTVFWSISFSVLIYLAAESALGSTSRADFLWLLKRISNSGV